jgi:formate dehydrogenase maturation protein FdhE
MGGRDFGATGTLTPWPARIARARRLAEERPFVAEPLIFYAALATLQERLLDDNRGDRPSRELGRLVPRFVTDVRHLGPSDLAIGLDSLAADEPWGEFIERYWKSAGREPGDANDVRLFVIEAVLQPFAEVAAFEARANLSPPTRSTRRTRPNRPACPLCGGIPLLSILREEGHGARRMLLCGLCLNEWPSLRLVCTACGEASFEKLPVYRAEEFDGARIDVCESCQAYFKTIDLTRDGNAEPVVDDLATLPLDLWARDKGYHRARPNLLRI